LTVHPWPSDDPFANPISPQIQDWFPYLRASVWTTDPAYGSGGSGLPSLTPTSSPDYVFNGWFGQTASIPNASANPAAVVLVTAGVGGPPNTLNFFFRAHLWRELVTSDTGTEISWQMQSDNIGLALNGVRLAVGVCARVQGGSMITTPPSLTGSTGYYFLLDTQSATPFGYKLVLLSVNGGTVTRLADTPAGASSFSPFSSGDFATPHRMRMTVATEAGNVRIRCYYSTEAQALANAEVEVFGTGGILDSSGTKITTPGRNGFVCSCERRPSAGLAVAPCINWWQFTTPDRVTTYVKDDWTRLNQQAGFVLDATHALKPGNALMSAWYGDAYSIPGVWPGATGVNTPQVMFHDGPASGIERIVLDPAAIAIDTDGFLISQRPADDPESQSRSIVGNYSSAGSGLQERAFGVGVRCNAPAPSTLPHCYYVVHEIDDVALTAVIRLHRSSFDGDTVIAEKTTGIPYALDTDTKIALSAATVSGVTKLRVRLNAVLVVLVAPAVPVTGISIAGDGTVDDASAQAVLTGAGEAIYVRKRWHNTGTMRRIYLDTWKQEAAESYTPPPPPPPPPPPADLTPIAVSGEIDGASGTLVLGAGGQWEIEQIVSNPGIVHHYENDTAQSFPIDSRIRRSWTITNNAVGSSADAALLSFFDAHGCETPFQWVTDDGDTAYVVFTTPDLPQKMRAASVFGYSFGLQERFP
jgi:hypothetical protein